MTYFVCSVCDRRVENGLEEEYHRTRHDLERMTRDIEQLIEVLNTWLPNIAGAIKHEQ